MPFDPYAAQRGGSPRLVRPAQGGMQSAPRGLRPGGGAYDLARLPNGRRNAGGPALIYPTGWCSLVGYESNTPHPNESLLASEVIRVNYGGVTSLSTFCVKFPQGTVTEGNEKTQFWYVGNIATGQLSWMQAWNIAGFDSWYSSPYIYPKADLLYSHKIFIYVLAILNDFDPTIVTASNAYANLVFATMYETIEIQRWIYTAGGYNLDVRQDGGTGSDGTGDGLPIIIPVKKDAYGFQFKVWMNFDSPGDVKDAKAVFTVAPAQE